MSRTFAAIAAAFAFTALVAGGSAAQAQANDPISGTSGSGSTMSGSTMSGAPMAAGAAPMARPAGQRRMHRQMRHERHAMRRQMRADRRAAANPDAAYMGGGAVYERTPDGGLRPVM